MNLRYVTDPQKCPMVDFHEQCEDSNKCPLDEVYHLKSR